MFIVVTRLEISIMHVVQYNFNSDVNVRIEWMTDQVLKSEKQHIPVPRDEEGLIKYQCNIQLWPSVVPTTNRTQGQRACSHVLCLGYGMHFVHLFKIIEGEPRWWEREPRLSLPHHLCSPSHILNRCAMGMSYWAAHAFSVGYCIINGLIWRVLKLAFFSKKYFPCIYFGVWSSQKNAICM